MLNAIYCLVVLVLFLIMQEFINRKMRQTLPTSTSLIPTSTSISQKLDISKINLTLLALLYYYLMKFFLAHVEFLIFLCPASFAVLYFFCINQLSWLLNRFCTWPSMVFLPALQHYICFFQVNKIISYNIFYILYQYSNPIFL